MEIELQTTIDAPVERCFDLARNIDVHTYSVAFSEEKAIGGVTAGPIGLGERVEWRARHFGIWLKMEVGITAYDRPGYFQDSMLSGPFRSFRHDHLFEARHQKTLMTDRLEFHSPVLLLGAMVDALVLRRYLRDLLETRNRALKAVAESERWRMFLSAENEG